jgi:hypothetical protein
MDTLACVHYANVACQFSLEILDLLTMLVWPGLQMLKDLSQNRIRR